VVVRRSSVYRGSSAVPVNVAAAPHRNSRPRDRLEIVLVAVVKTGCGGHFVDVAPPPGNIRPGESLIGMRMSNIYGCFSGKIMVMDVTRHGNPSLQF